MAIDIPDVSDKPLESHQNILYGRHTSRFLDIF